MLGGEAANINFIFSGFTQFYILWFHSIICSLVSLNFISSGFTQLYVLWFHSILYYLVSSNFIFTGFTQFYVLWLHPILYSLVSPNQRSNPWPLGIYKHRTGEKPRIRFKNQDQTLPHLCACLKARSAFLTSYNSYMYIKAYNNSIYNNKSKNRKKL